MPNSIIAATGCYIPKRHIPNSYFLNCEFYTPDGLPMEKANAQIIETLYNITGIKERRYVDDEMTTTDIAYAAAAAALEGIDRESLDYIIVAQNFGDVRADNLRSDMVPTIASRVKHLLKIENPYCVAYDIPFGCPGWLQGMIMADYYIRSGDAKRILVIGAEILSRVADPHDIDCMIFADGAGATVVEASDKPAGILAHVTRTDAEKHGWLLHLGKTYHPDLKEDALYIKMDGHDIYRYALKTVPLVVKQALDKAGLTLSDVSKILMHQANAKMDEAILARLFRLYGADDVPEGVMPMIIHWAGNSSVATIPTMLDCLLKDRIEGHRLASGEVAVFASVGAGMNTNAMVYRMP